MKRMISILAVGVFTLAAAGCGSSNAASGGGGEEFPENGKSVELVVAFSPGGPVDTAARLIQPILEKELGTNVEVVNKPGAGGQIGYTALANAKADGYTIGAVGSPSIVVIPMDESRGAAFTRDDLQPLGRQVVDPMVIAVQTDSKYSSLKDLIEDSKANPGALNATTTGQMGGEHFAIAQINEATGSALTPVHFSEGASQASTAFLGKHVEVLVGNISEVVDLANQGKARVLGVMDAERTDSLPDVPTFTEEGYDVIATTARGYAAPEGLPEEVGKKLEAALQTAIEDETVVEKMENLGLATSYQNAADYDEFWTRQEGDYKAVLPLVQAK
ncbi:tripartite tricarboxylate transporter substrate binding protein [Glutamicibacter sp. PAEs-4]|uniref:tripartite tricarboxylate transporter substrate binding protein n=1 Tax=Glutamicibacter TaxID=1742989 RepID=UPI000EF8C71D|nr:tripartite tricarboxylate transporter substrate binding protein [Glutamicibacter nicotianae]WIV44189.1 tripartite tricarboxylate transporter substrate binding protein [Glutamicibacter nicotianae]